MSISARTDAPVIRPIGAEPTSGDGGGHRNGAWTAVLERLKSFVRRSPRAMQFYRSLDVPLAGGLVQIDAAQMERIVQSNRALLAGFGPWIDVEAMQRSKFSYGLSPDWAAAMAREISTKTTYSDLLCYAAAQTPKTAYLEIGVSVGKNFWQVLNHVIGGELVAMDIEEINPPLRNKLSVVAASEAPAPRLDRYRFDARSNDVCYCTGDVFDPALWDKLAGRKFNLVFSDAFHDPAAVMYEWQKIVELDLLDRSGFTMIWDDLVSRKIRRVFNDITADCIKRYGLSPRNACLMHAAGWVGEFEPAHPIGVISSRNFVG
jgi:hypothetical protein